MREWKPTPEEDVEEEEDDEEDDDEEEEALDDAMSGERWEGCCYYGHL